MYRSNTCGELNAANIGQTVTLAGWVQKVRNLGAMTFIDLRDRYGTTQLVVGDNSADAVKATASSLGREFVIQVKGKVVEREAKNSKMATGEIEIEVESLTVLSRSLTPPFTIENNSDGGDEIRMRYRYLDIRRNPVKEALMLRHRMAQSIRRYLDNEGFLEIETPYLIRSTPEGARDFVVPSRMNQGEFYALPQSPQQYKQLLMVAGMDKYFQIVRCFRDEDLRADRQPEFTQIDCEMSFVEQQDVIDTFEGLVKELFGEILGISFDYRFPQMSWKDAMAQYGSDKPDIRFGMKFQDLTQQAHTGSFAVFDQAEYVGAVVAEGCAVYTRKQIDELTEFVKRPQVGAKGLVWIRLEAEGGIKSSIDKFFDADTLRSWAERCGAKAGDLIMIVAGERMRSLTALGELRLEMGRRLGLRDKNKFAPLWVVDFPLLEWDEETKRFYAMHHPFTMPNPDDLGLFESNPGAMRANAYDCVINGVEVGGGSIRIHDSELQSKMFDALGFSHEDAHKQFGFLMDAFQYGAPPHGGIAFGFDRLCSMFGGSDSIRDYIAFPKNNSGRDTMSDSPAPLAQAQLDELSLEVVVKE